MQIHQRLNSWTRPAQETVAVKLQFCGSMTCHAGSFVFQLELVECLNGMELRVLGYSGKCGSCTHEVHQHAKLQKMTDFSKILHAPNYQK
ncbi:unnamed protein product [Clavelina lepadiformis]|uniref:Uncharacterized protein n=1 Tax=Clavelina lepadiformis TaxID=159417 RepID=A0ABP0F809_CLALP